MATSLSHDTPMPETTNATRLRIRQLAPFVMLAMLGLEVVVFSLLSPDEFATTTNFRTTLATQAVLGILTLAMMMPLIAGDFDVSLAMVFTTSMLVAATLEAEHGWPLWAAALLALFVSSMIGAISGLVVVLTQADSLVVTLGMLTLLRGLTEAITEGNTVTVSGDSAVLLRSLSTPLPFGIPLPIFFLAAIATLLWYFTEQTPTGRYWYAVGGSPEGARLAGLRTRRMRIAAFTTGGFLAGVAGLVQLTKSLTATANFGAGFLFPALAAAFLGAAGFRLGVFNVRGSITAILLLAVGVTGIRMSGAPLWIDEVFNGAALVAAVAIVGIVRRKGGAT